MLPLAYALRPSRTVLCRGTSSIIGSQSCLFSTTSPSSYKAKNNAALTKKKLAAKARKKASTTPTKAPTSVYDAERMTLLDAMHVLRCVEVASPSSTYELTVKTEMKKGTAVPKGRVALPYEPKKKEKDTVLVFADGQQAIDAKAAGADIVGGAEIIEAVASGRLNATTILCTPGLIRAITPRLGRILGPRGMMPSERRGTVTEDIAGYIRRLSGSNEWRGDKKGTIRIPIGKITFPVENVIENVNHFMDSVKKATGNIPQASGKDSNAPKNPIVKVVLSSTQGPGISVSDLL
ncbi:ribosomal protein L1 [Sistotremastrum suecicum HHB10207 ss-3]|uniref:Ribosomal protein n=1 Tax=Sistotremastrum suecicum HHB10207 ss-3 TaxID=1314776 RepID=A0A165ZZY9_9AGAM|nr:ribosomal protein L1 [Sistotremastrum suecicum HHB10207 ss-3]